MRLRGWLAVFLVVTVTGLGQSRAQSGAGVVVIDGSKDPGAFPAWKVAEITLRHLGELSRQESTSTTAGDRELLRLSIEAFSEADKKTAEEFEKGRREGILNQPLDVIRKDEHRMRLEYRYRLLEIFDKLSSELSPDGRVALQLLSQAVVASTQVLVRREDLARFREPR